MDASKQSIFHGLIRFINICPLDYIRSFMSYAKYFKLRVFFSWRKMFIKANLLWLFSCKWDLVHVHMVFRVEAVLSDGHTAIIVRTTFKDGHCFVAYYAINIPQTEYKLLQMSTMHTNTVWNMKKQWNISNVHDTQWTDGTSSVVCIIRITVFFTTHHNLSHIALLKLELTLQIWHPKPLLLNPCKFNVLHYVQCTLYMYTCFPYSIILKRIFTGLSRFEAIIIMDLRDFNYLLML